MNVLKNKKGNSYIYLCVLTIAISLLISVIVLYMGLMAQVRIQKKDVQAKLDSYLAEYSTEAYDALKQGATKENYIDWEKFEANTYVTLGFPDESVAVYQYENGNCSMTRPTVTVLRGDGFGVSVEYTARYPVVWNGKTYSNLEIPVIVTSYYKMR